MDAWIERYAAQAEHVLQSGNVRSVEFSGSTYLIEVYDPEEQKSFWPFLQFDEEGKLKDAFCSCALEEGCVHLAAAYLKSFGSYAGSNVGSSAIPLHLRFEHSFWNQIGRLFGSHTGYDERFLEKKGDGHYLYHNDVQFEIEAKTEAARERLTRLVENRRRETPENSIKFSNIPQEEIAHWREGRPGPDLRYALSFWSDLAQWMMSLTEESIWQFNEDHEGYPTCMTIDFPPFVVRFEIKRKDLPLLIPSLDGVNSPLKVIHTSQREVEKITFDPESGAFDITHAPSHSTGESQHTLPLEGWAYLPGVGFYPKNGHSLLGRDRIGRENAARLLEEFPQQVARFIPVHETTRPVHYTVYFDADWNWHFEAYLFQPGDLKQQNSVLLGRWAFLEGKGFYPVQDVLFEEIQKILRPAEVSSFVNHHRIWLNGREGFQTHLASIESHLSYTLKGGSLRFYTKASSDTSGGMDFGDWIYYVGQGFFSKKHARLGLVIRPGLEVREEDIATFIKTNQEELENIPRFFISDLPLASRGLEVGAHSPTSLYVKPVYTLLPAFKNKEVLFFGDFVYLVAEGFCEMPLGMRIPEAYEKPLSVSQHALNHFLEAEFPALKKYLLKLDASLKQPHQCALAVHYLARTSGGSLKAQLYYHTENGKIAVTDLLQTIEHKRRYCFTEAGLIDTQSDLFQWVRHFKNPYQAEAQTVELSTMEFIRLDASLGFLGPTEESPTTAITRGLIRELREFTSHEVPNLKGLKSELRLYQQTGLHWLWFLYRHGLSGLLCDDMGLGKTHQAMALIAGAMNVSTTEKHNYLVVCPTSVIYHWQDKLETFLPHLPVQTFHGVKRSLSSRTGGLILTSYGILRSEQKMFETIPFDVAIFDEVQLAKNPNSRVHDALKKVKARTRIGLSGTPIENNLRELKALFDVVLPGYMPSEARFRELFIHPIERDASEEKRALLSQIIRPFVLRRKKSEVLQELPEKSEDKSYCELSAEQKKLYQETLSQNQDSLIATLSDQNATVNYVHVFSLLARLKQVCDHPALVHKDPAYYKKYASGKWDLFVELLEEARESEQKVVIFSQYLYMLDIFEHYLKERGWGYAQIRGDTIKRREELKRFQEDPTCVVFIGSLQAAGLGIDLTAASVVILYDRWWNAARENQAIDRVHRIGQKWGVQVYKLITKNTIEEKIDKMITRKGRLLEEVVMADDQALLKKFSRSELIELLSFHEEESN